MLQKANNFLLRLSKYASEEIKLPLIIALVIETLSSLNVMCSLFKSSFLQSVQSYQLLEIIKQVILASGLVTLWNWDAKLTPFVVILGISALFLIIYGLLYVYLTVTLLFNHKKKLKVTEIIGLFSLIHSRIFFYPFHYFYLQILNSNSKTHMDDNSFLTNTSVFIISAILLSVNFDFAATKELLFFRIVKSKNTFSSKNNFHSRIVLLHKTLIPILIIFVSDGKGKSIVIAILTLLFSLLALYNLIIKLPFYNLTLSRCSYVLMSFTLSLSVIALAYNIGLNSHLSELLLIITSVLIIKSLKLHLENCFDKILRGEFGNAEQAIHYPILLKQYTSKYSGLILVRHTFPENTLFFYSSFGAKYDDTIKENDPILKKQIKQEFYSNILEKMSSKNYNSHVFNLFKCMIYIKKLSNASQAISLMNKMKANKPSIPIQNSMQALKFSLQQTYYKTFSQQSSDNLELADYFNYREFNSLKKIMQTEIEYQLQFWQEMSKDTVEVKKAIHYSNQMDQIYNKIRNIWRSKANIFTQVYPSSLLMYGLYLDLIRGLPSESVPMIQKFSNYNKSVGFKQKFGILDESSALILASVEKEKSGVIVDASSTVQTVFKTPKEMMIGSKINMLMPSFISRKHDFFMQRYHQQTIVSPARKTISTFAKAFDDFIIDIDLSLSLYPYLEKGVNMLAEIRQTNLEGRTLVVSPSGIVVAISSKFQQDCEDLDLDFKGVNLEDISLDFLKINRAFNKIFIENQNSTQNEYEGFDQLSKRFLSENPTTKENHLLTNHTMADLASALTLKTKPIEEALSTNTFEGIESTKSVKKAFFKEKGGLRGINPSPPKTDSLNETEAKEICDKFKEGSIFLLKNFSTVNSNYESISLEALIQPYILQEEIYIIVRVSHMEFSNSQVKGNKFTEKDQLKFLNSHNTKPGKQFLKGSSSNDSQTQDISQFDIPEEKMDNIHEIATHILKVEANEQPYFRKLNAPVEQSKETTGKLTNTKELSHVKAHAMNDLDMRHSLTGKGASSTKSYSHIDLKLIKILNDFFGQDKIRLITKMSIYAVYVIMTSIFILAVVNYFLTQQSLKEIGNGVTISDTASTRLTTSLRAWQWALIVYARVVGLRQTATFSGASNENLYTESILMQDMNNKLKSDLNDFGNDDMVREIFGTPIRMYDPITGELMMKGEIDSFTANQLISIKFLLISNWSGTNENLRLRPEPLMTINNTGNDYLLTSERQIESIHIRFQEIISNNENLAQIVLIVENMALFALGVAIMLVARVVFQTHSRTFTALVRLSPQSTEERIMMIKKFDHTLKDNIENRSFSQNFSLFFNFLEDQTQKKALLSKSKEKNLKIFHRSFTMKSLIISISKFIAISFGFLLTTSAIFAILYIKSLGSFRTLSSINDQLSVTNKLSYQSSLVISSFYFSAIFREYDNFMIRNERDIIQLDKNLNAFGNVNQELIRVIFSEDSYSRDDPILQHFLQENVCEYIPSNLQSICEESSQERKLGLLRFNIKYHTESENFINLLKRARTEAGIRYLAENYLETVAQDVTILDASYTFLTLHILNEFRNHAQDLEKLNLILSLIAIAFIVITTIVVQTVTLNKLIRLDNSQKKLFRSLTYHVFSQNKAVGFLLKKDFGEEVEGLNRVLFGN